MPPAQHNMYLYKISFKVILLIRILRIKKMCHSLLNIFACCWFRQGLYIYPSTFFGAMPTLRLLSFHFGVHFFILNKLEEFPSEYIAPLSHIWLGWLAWVLTLWLPSVLYDDHIASLMLSYLAAISLSLSLF